MWLRRISALLLAGVVFLGTARANESFSGLISKGSQAFQTAKFDEAERYYRLAAAFAEKAGDGSALGRAKGELGLVFIAKSGYKEARSLYLESLEILRRSESKEYLPVVLNNLGLLSILEEDYAQSRIYLKEALDVIKKTDPHHPYAARTYRNLGVLYYKLDDLGKAEKAFKKSIEFIEKETAADRADLAPALANLAVVYTQKGKWKEAAPLFDRALSLIQQFPAASQLEAAGIVENVAIMYYAREQFVASENALRAVYRLRLRVLGSGHPAVAAAEVHLADTLAALNRHDEAERLLLDALRIYETAFGWRSPETATTLETLARLFRKSRRESEAAELSARAESIRFDLAHTVSIERLH